MLNNSRIAAAVNGGITMAAIAHGLEFSHLSTGDRRLRLSSIYGCRQPAF